MSLEIIYFLVYINIYSSARLSHYFIWYRCGLATAGIGWSRMRAVLATFFCISDQRHTLDLARALGCIFQMRRSLAAAEKLRQSDCAVCPDSERPKVALLPKGKP